jgi:hypothetical protein
MATGSAEIFQGQQLDLPQYGKCSGRMLRDEF